MEPQPQGTILLVGVGGLGCPAALELVACGVRSLVLVDPDVVALDNLHRQVLYTTEDIGRPKAQTAADRLRRLRPELAIRAIDGRFEPDLLDGVSCVLEGSDDLDTKFAVSDACVMAGVPAVVGGVVGWDGVIVRTVPGGPCYRCVFEAPPDEAPPTCAQAGVFGPVAGWVGATMARYALDPPSAAVWALDGRAGRSRVITVERDPSCRVCAVPELDITAQMCPMTYVHTRLALEDMDPGDRLAVVMRRGEPAANVPRNLREEGHRVVTAGPASEDRYRILVEKC